MEIIPESASLPGLSMFTTPTDPRNTSEIVFRENGVVIGQERRALPLSQ